MYTNLKRCLIRRINSIGVSCTIFYSLSAYLNMSIPIVFTKKLSATMELDPNGVSEVAIANEKTSNRDQKVPKVEFVSADGKSFFVEEKVARKFKLGDEITERLLEGNKCTHVLGIHSEILTIMIKWAEHHVDDPETNDDVEDDDDTVKRVDDIDEWDKKLLDLKVETLFRLANTVRKVPVGGFSKVLSKKLASLLKGKSSAEIREILNLPKAENERKRKLTEE